MHTLWRNDELLAQIENPPPGRQSADPATVYGIVRPTPAFAGMKPMMQSYLPTFPNAPVFQNEMEDFVIPQPADALARRPPAPVELTPLNPEEALGVPAEQRLEVRRDDGTVFNAQIITLMHFVVSDTVDIAEVQREWGTSDDTRERWTVIALETS